MRCLLRLLVKYAILPLGLVLLTFIPGFADLKRPQDVIDAMNELFLYHVDHKQMSEVIIRNSLKVYVESFDPNKMYLTAKEVEPYLSPSNAKVEEILNEYHQGNFTAYEELDVLFEKAVHRFRDYRKQLEKEPKELIKLSNDPVYWGEEEEKYASNESQLKTRQKKAILLFVKLEKEKGKKSYTQEELGKRISALYESKIRSIENPYLANSGNKTSFYERVTKSFARSLDAHTDYYTSQEAYSMRVQLEKGFKGVGVVLEENVDGIVIARLIRGGPADDSGMVNEGDVVLGVNNKPCKGHSFEEVLDWMQGDSGKVKLSLARLNESGKEERLEVDLRQSQVVIKDQRIDVSYIEVPGGIIGKISLYGFYEGENGVSSEKDVRNAIRDFKRHGKLKGLVLDLRQNMGGFLLQAVKVAGLFIKNGIVVVSKYGNGEQQYLRDMDGYAYYRGPLVILTSKMSASAAEVVAQALQDYGVALVVGDEQTYGKGSIQHQTVTDVNANAFFKVTVGRYYTPSGRSTQIQGVKADIVVPTIYNDQRVGERYLEFPLACDQVAPCFKDTLSDIDPMVRIWFEKFYLPSLEKPETVWKSMLPILRKKSSDRIATNKEYQRFMEEIKHLEDLTALSSDKDLPMDEAINVVKDMINLEPHVRVSINESGEAIN